MKIKDINRTLIVLAIFSLLVVVGRIESIVLTFSFVFLFLGFIPGIVLLALTAIIGSFVIKVFHYNKLMVIAFLTLLISQSVILFFWVEGWTAASAFVKHTPEIGLPVIDPQIENRLMIAFWLLAAFVVALTIEHLINSFRSIETNLFRNGSNKARIGILLLEAFLLVSLNSSLVNYKRMSRDVNVPSSKSADGTKEIQLVPMNAWIDTNGIVIARKQNSLVWRTVGEIGDSLTESDGGRFAWSNDGSKVYLLLNFHKEKDFPMLGFDFEANKQIDPKSYVERK